MYMLLKDGKKRVLTLSYDDGVIQDRRLIEIMNKHGLKGTFNINSGLYLPEKETYKNPGKRRLKLSDAKELYIGSGHEIAIHGLNHKFMERLPKTEMIKETISDRLNLEKDFGGIVRGMAYPYGTWNEELSDVLDSCGIVYSRTTLSTENFDFPKNWLTLNPTCHHNNPRLMELAEQFIKEERYSRSRMFYLWGHAYEFDDNDNWYIIEKFAEYMGGRDDIWYATNIEIYNYVKAYENLILSADCSAVYNPSSVDVWIDTGGIDTGDTVCVRAGETIRLK